MAEQHKKATTPAATNRTNQGGLSFIAEIKQVSSKKTASLDIEYRLVLASDDPMVNTLGLIGADSLVRVTVEVE